MTTHQAKKDVAAKLQAIGITPEKLSASTVGMQDLARCSPIFVKIHGAELKDGWKEHVMAGVPKPSDGGYCVETASCYWFKDGKKIYAM